MMFKHYSFEILNSNDIMTTPIRWESVVALPRWNKRNLTFNGKSSKRFDHNVISFLSVFDAFFVRKFLNPSCLSIRCSVFGRRIQCVKTRIYLFDFTKNRWFRNYATLSSKHQQSSNFSRLFTWSITMEAKAREYIPNDCKE